MVADMEIRGTMAHSAEAWVLANKDPSTQHLAHFEPSRLAAKWLCHLDSSDGGMREAWYHHPKWSGSCPALKAVFKSGKRSLLLQGKSDFISSPASQKLEWLVVYWAVEENAHAWHAHKSFINLCKGTYQRLTAFSPVLSGMQLACNNKHLLTESFQNPLH